MSENSGKVSQIIGPVVDVTFENNEQGLPDIYDSLVIKKENGEDVLLEETRIKTIITKPEEKKNKEQQKNEGYKEN